MTTRSRLRGVTQSFAAAAVLLIAAGCNGSAGGTATPAPGASASGSTTVPSTVPGAAGTTLPVATAGPLGTPVEVLDFTLQPLTVDVTGSNVILDVTNAGPTVHNVTIRDDAGMILGATRDLREGEGETIDAEIPAGTYVLFCSLPGHESLGIKGTLTVSAP